MTVTLPSEAVLLYLKDRGEDEYVVDPQVWARYDLKIVIKREQVSLDDEELRAESRRVIAEHNKHLSVDELAKLFAKQGL